MANFNLMWIKNNLKIESAYGLKVLAELSAFKSGQESEARTFFASLAGIITSLKKNNSLFNDLNKLFMDLRNISGSVNNLHTDITLGETELFEIKNFAIIVSDIAKLCLKNNISPEIFADKDIEPVILLLNPDSMITRSFYIHEAWSDELKSIREQKKLIEAQILAAADNDEKSRLRALRADFVNKESEAELVVRKKLSDGLKQYLPILDYYVKNIGQLELLLAKAQIALEYDCCCPEIYDSDSVKSIVFKDAVEPEIAESLKKNGKVFTPVNINLQRGVTILTGANMGGKSVALSTIAFNSELIRYGFFPFAHEIAMKIPDFIELVSGDNQDSKAGLSSFGADIKKINVVLEKIKKGSGLVICDEFGRTTNPYEGSRFVQALCDRLQNSDSFAILATHYDGICTVNAAYYQVLGLKSLLERSLKADLLGTMDLSDFMDYRLVESTMNSEVPREALKIAILLGLPQDFIDSIKKYYN